jgi:hypothetical protein
MGTVLHLRTINQTTEPRSQTNLIWQTAGKVSLGCGQLSVGGWGGEPTLHGDQTQREQKPLRGKDEIVWDGFDSHTIVCVSAAGGGSACVCSSSDPKRCSPHRSSDFAGALLRRVNASGSLKERERER